MKENKGITLVALIITIIVLLILAVVTINAVNEGSLFAHANNAATAYSQRAEEENSIISSYIGKIEKIGKGESDIWTKRGLDTSIPGIIGTIYVFPGPIVHNDVQFTNIKIQLNSDGSMYWGRESNIESSDYSIITSEEFESILDEKIGEVHSNSIVFPDGPFDGMVTVTYSDNTATLTVDGTDYVSENNVNNVWKTEFGLTTPNAKFFTNDINEAKYVGSIMEQTVTAGLCTDGSVRRDEESYTVEQMREKINAGKNNDTTVEEWVIVGENYLEFTKPSKNQTYRYEFKDDGKLYGYLNGAQLIVFELVTE
jgi:hypothetical protein